MATPPRSTADRLPNAPRSFPIGVRAPATMTEPLMKQVYDPPVRPLESGRRRNGPSGRWAYTRGVDVRFGVSVIPSASGRSDPVDEARHAEQVGFDLVTVWDHLHGERPSYETWTLL